MSTPCVHNTRNASAKPARRSSRHVSLLNRPYFFPIHALSPTRSRCGGSNTTGKVLSAKGRARKSAIRSGLITGGLGTLSEEIGSGDVDWKHDLQSIMRMNVNIVTIPSYGQAPLGFSSRESTGDYAFYYPDTSSGGIVLTHELSCMVISISVPATGLLTIVVKIDGAEYFSCQGSGSVTLTREMIPVGSTITFTAINGTGSSVTTASSARVIVSGANLK